MSQNRNHVPRSWCGDVGGAIILAVAIGMMEVFLSPWATGDPVVSNIHVAQRTDGSKQVDIRYDLSQGHGPMSVRLEVSSDDGQTWSVIPSDPALSGAVGPGISNGVNLHIVWDTRGDLPVTAHWPRVRVRLVVEEGAVILPEELTIQLPGDVPLVLRRIPAGTFQMGSPAGEQDRGDDEGPVHTVTLTQDFYMGKYTVTKAQWTAVMGTTPWTRGDGVLDDPNSPAVYVSWNDIVDEDGFMDRLNIHLASTGQTVAGTVRVPTEAQWEYAARAGTTTRFYWGNDPDHTQIGAYAWYGARAGETNTEGEYAHVVGRKIPNAWGLYDMSGNVWEWCQDWYSSSYPSAPQTDPSGPYMGSSRVLRGGAWHGIPRDCRSAYRSWYSPTLTHFISVGFRVVSAPGK